jgi:nucleotide-binding universal stress UspA family protein
LSKAIVVGTDGSERAGRALHEAIRMAAALGAQLHVVSAYEPLRGARIVGAPEAAAKIWAPQPDAEVQATLGEAAASVRAHDVEVTTHAVSKDPADALLEVAAEVEAEMIVVGNKGMHGAQRFVLGNVPNKVSHRAPCNVLIVSTGKAE